MLKDKVRPDKLLKGKFQLENIDPKKFYLNFSFINFKLDLTTNTSNQQSKNE